MTTYNCVTFSDISLFLLLTAIKFQALVFSVYLSIVLLCISCSEWVGFANAGLTNPYIYLVTGAMLHSVMLLLQNISCKCIATPMLTGLVT